MTTTIIAVGVLALLTLMQMARVSKLKTQIKNLIKDTEVVLDNHKESIEDTGNLANTLKTAINKGVPGINIEENRHYLMLKNNYQVPRHKLARTPRYTVSQHAEKTYGLEKAAAMGMAIIKSNQITAKANADKAGKTGAKKKK